MLGRRGDVSRVHPMRSVMSSHRTGLSVLFLLQGIAMAMWFVPLSPVLEAHGLGALRPYAFATSSVAGLVTPLIFGAFADRHASPVAVLRWVSAATAVMLALTNLAIERHAPPMVVLFLIQLQSLLSTPTWSLLTAAGLAGLKDAKREFGPIRAFGTFGWMAGCVLVSALGADASTRAGFSACAFWIAVAVVAAFVPSTPLPRAEGSVSARERLGLDALRLLRIPDHRVVFLTAALVTIPLAAFYPFAPSHLRDLGFSHTSAWMALAQVTEVIAMFGLGTMLANIRLKWVLATGLGFAVLRFVLLASGTKAAVLVGVSLHGFAFTLFFVAVPIYLNEHIEAGWRTRAQALLSLMTQGIGGLTGYLGSGLWLEVCQRQDGSGTTSWPLFWGGLATIVAAVYGYFLIAYHERPSGAPAISGRW